MRNFPLALVLALLASSFIVYTASAQTQSVFGDRRPNTAADLQEALVKYSYTWEVEGGKASVAFLADGTGKSAFFNFTWRVKSAQEVELTMAGSANKADLIFNDSYTAFAGRDFDGKRAVRGAMVAPSPAAATPAPVIAATPMAGGPASATPAAAPASTNSNPFLDEHLPGDSGTADSTDALQKAIIGQKFTWEHETGTNLETVVFEADGKGRQTFFDIAWRAKTAHEVEISIPDKRSPGKIVLRFNGDYTKYTATDFDGDPLKGHKVAK